MTQFPSVFRNIQIEEENQNAMQCDQNFPENNFSQACNINSIPFGLPKEQGKYNIK